MRLAQAGAVGKAQRLDLILTGQEPVLDGDLIRSGCIAGVVDLDHQVVAGAAHEQVAGRNPGAKHDPVCLVVVAVVVVANGVLAISPIEHIRVGAASTLNPVVAGTPGVGVGIDIVAPVITVHLDDIVAHAALYRIAGAGTEVHRIVALAPAQGVCAAALVGDDVVAGTAIDRVAAVAVRDRVVAIAAVDCVIPRSGCDCVATTTGANEIAIGIANDGIAVSRSDEQPPCCATV